MKTDNSSFERVEESNIWEQLSQIKILFRKKLRADWIQGKLVIIRCRIFCLAGCCPKI